MLLKVLGLTVRHRPPVEFLALEAGEDDREGGAGVVVELESGVERHTVVYEPESFDDRPGRRYFFMAVLSASGVASPQLA